MGVRVCVRMFIARCPVYYYLIKLIFHFYDRDSPSRESLQVYWWVCLVVCRLNGGLDTLAVKNTA